MAFMLEAPHDTDMFSVRAIVHLLESAFLLPCHVPAGLATVAENFDIISVCSSTIVKMFYIHFL